MAPTRSSTPAANARPVEEGERLVLLDTPRGFALCGVFMANVYLWFSGRMFTNYLLTSVLGVLLFYGDGLGLMGKTGPAAQLALTLALFALQIVFSHLWMARFRFGPAEWLTRSLTYGKAQPMRRASVTQDKELVNA